MGTIQLYPTHGATFGTDPELFLGRQLKTRFTIVGSEQIVPEGGSFDGTYPLTGVTRDGVQCELHAGGEGYSCRQAFAGSIQTAMIRLRDCVSAFNKAKHNRNPVTVSFSPLITLTQREMKRLSPEARLLNCRESLNAYGRPKIIKDGNTYMIRSGSGHIHFGTQGVTKANAPSVVKLLDAILGVVCVLVARNPAEAIRRETYGRAGEYRLPRHGLEYRVPSNFWLLDYVLQSMVTGIGRQALYIAFSDHHGNPGRVIAEGVREGVEKVGGWSIVEKAINENDWTLAMRIYKTALQPSFARLYGSYPLCGDNASNFEYFVDTIREQAEKDQPGVSHPGLSRWFNTDHKAIMNRWIAVNTATGWERFLYNIVQPRRLASKFTGIILDPEKDVAKAGVVQRRSGVEEQLAA